MSETAVILMTANLSGPSDGAYMTKVDGRESVMRAMELFANREGVIQTIFVIDKANAEVAKQKLGSHLMFMGIKLVQAGSTWAEQLAEAQKVLKPEAKFVIVHDAARCAVPYTDLDALVDTSTKHPAVALAAPIRGALMEAPNLPGPAKSSSAKLAQLLTPMIYTRSTFDTMAASGEPADLFLIEGSQLNVRCGQVDPGFVKAMIGLLPKPKMKAPSSPFEEAQW